MPERPQPARSPDAVRVRRSRDRSGRSGSTLIDLAALGGFLAGLGPDDLARFTRTFGEETVQRARIVAAAVRAGRDAPALVRDVAS